MGQGSGPNREFGPRLNLIDDPVESMASKTYYTTVGINKVIYWILVDTFHSVTGLFGGDISMSVKIHVCICDTAELIRND